MPYVDSDTITKWINVRLIKNLLGRSESCYFFDNVLMNKKYRRQFSVFFLAQKRYKVHSNPSMKKKASSNISEPCRPNPAKSRAINRARKTVSAYTDYEREKVLELALAFAKGAACAVNKPK